MRTGAVARRRTATPPPQDAPRRAGKGVRTPEFESGRDKVARDSLLTAAEVLALGGALADLLSTPGWRLFETLLDRMKSHAAMQGIRDAKQPKEYVAGKLDMVDEIQSAVATYIAEAQKLAGAGDKPRADRRVVAAMLPGSRRAV